MGNRIAVFCKMLVIIILIALAQIPIYFMQQYAISIIGDDYFAHLQSRAINYVNQVVESVQGQQPATASAIQFDNYQFVINILKSNYLTLTLAFLWLLLIDTFKNAKLSWVNYLIVAIGLVLFYLLALVLANYCAISLFYIIAAVICTVLMVTYLSGALHSIFASLVYGIGLLGIYTLAYYLTLYINNVLAYVAICLLMLFMVIVVMTRNINWQARAEVTKGSAEKLN